MTLPLRTRLAVVYGAIFSSLLAALSLVSYRVFERQLDADLSANLTELADGLHGYLRFEDGTVSVAFDENDADQAAFVQAATRYYQVYDAETGRLLVQSDALEPIGLQFTPGEVQAYREHPRPVDIRTTTATFACSAASLRRDGARATCSRSAHRLIPWMRRSGVCSAVVVGACRWPRCRRRHRALDGRLRARAPRALRRSGPPD
jgi:hypothetical protein